jgi:hypothetical protein
MTAQQHDYISHTRVYTKDQSHSNNDNQESMIAVGFLGELVVGEWTGVSWGLPGWTFVLSKLSRYCVETEVHSLDGSLRSTDR